MSIISLRVIGSQTENTYKSVKTVQRYWYKDTIKKKMIYYCTFQQKVLSVYDKMKMKRKIDYDDIQEFYLFRK